MDGRQSNALAESRSHQKRRKRKEIRGVGMLKFMLHGSRHSLKCQGQFLTYMCTELEKTSASYAV